MLENIPYWGSMHSVKPSLFLCKWQSTASLTLFKITDDKTFLCTDNSITPLQILQSAISSFLEIDSFTPSFQSGGTSSFTPSFQSVGTSFVLHHPSSLVVHWPGQSEHLWEDCSRRAGLRMRKLCHQTIAEFSALPECECQQIANLSFDQRRLSVPRDQQGTVVHYHVNTDKRVCIVYIQFVR